MKYYTKVDKNGEIKFVSFNDFRAKQKDCNNCGNCDFLNCKIVQKFNKAIK